MCEVKITDELSTEWDGMSGLKLPLEFYQGPLCTLPLRTWATERNTGQLATELATSSPSGSFPCSLFCTLPLSTQTALRNTMSFLLSRTAYQCSLCISPPVLGLQKETQVSLPLSLLPALPLPVAHFFAASSAHFL